MRIGLLGAGHLGKIHLKCLQNIPEYELVGFYDPDENTAREVAQTFDILAFASEAALIEAVDVVDIVTPTTTHFEVASRVIEAGKHCFIEKPITHTLDEARKLLALSEGKDLIIQIGHVERFNPALLAVKDVALNPMFIEAHRLAVFNPRGTDVSVVLDLMIHDLDIVLHMVPSKVSFISASGVAVVSDSPDICNARIEFENGCVANLTASRISVKQMRKIRLFQRDAYISLDLLEKKTQLIRLYDQPDPAFPDRFELPTNKGSKYLQIDMPEIAEVNAIQMELEQLLNSIKTGEAPAVSIEEGCKAMALAIQIIEEIERRHSTFGA